MAISDRQLEEMMAERGVAVERTIRWCRGSGWNLKVAAADLSGDGAIGS